jgi:transposase
MDIETWAFIRHLCIAENKSVSAIARKLQIDRKTVRAALNKNSFLDRQKNRRQSLLDPHREDIMELLDEHPALSAVRIFEEIRKKGYEGQITILRDYLRKLRASRKDPYFRLSVPAGRQGQADWGHCGQFRIGTTTRPLYCFVLILSYSRAIHLEFTLTMSQETFLESHVRGFRFFHGCPREILYDNLSSVVLSRIGTRVRMNQRFLDFSGFFGFHPTVCNVGKPREKGKVEMGVKYIKQNFLAGRSFTSMEELQQQALRWRDEIANVRIHKTTRKPPVELLEEERPYLITLPESNYDTSLKRAVVCPPDAFITFQTNRYSVPFSCVGKELVFKADMHKVRIIDGQKPVAEHQRCYDRHQCIEKTSHRKKLLEQRSRATLSKAFEELCDLGPECKEYLEGLNRCEINLKNHVMFILRLSQVYGTAEIRQAISHALSYEAFGAEYIENIIVNLRRRRHAQTRTGPISIKSRPELSSITVNPHSMDIYEYTEHDPGNEILNPTKEECTDEEKS